jgi:hypothetical protein
MPDNKVTVLDVLARIESLEQKNKALEKEINELKAQQDPENWRELILYRTFGEKNKPIEVTWTEDLTAEKEGYYKDDDSAEKMVIGLVRKV